MVPAFSKPKKICGNSDRLKKEGNNWYDIDRYIQVVMGALRTCQGL